VVSVVHVHKGPLPGPYDLDGRNVSQITAYLFHTGGNEDPARLHVNAEKSFQGSIAFGMGFTFDDNDKKGVASPITKARADELARSGDRPISMEEILAEDSRNRERIFPYIGGEEVNSSPTQTHHRYVINFEQMNELEARRWPNLVRILEEKVKPERQTKARDVASWPWWQFWRPRAELYAAIRGLNRVLVICRHQPHWCIAFLAAGAVYSEATIVIAMSSNSAFSLFQSRPHEVWARFFGSSLEDRLRYTPSDCFETYPFPVAWETNSQLESLGKDYHEHRAQLMRDSNKGLTKTYNRFHDPKERLPEIRRLREMHTAMDRAVLAAYGWSDIDTNCGFDLDWCEAEPADDASPETLERLDTGRFFFESAEEARAFAAELENGGKGLGWRYRWRPEVRDEVLARLLLLNAQRAEEERRAGLSPLEPAPADEDDELMDEGEDDEDEQPDDDD
jgi:hypothetical protein